MMSPRETALEVLETERVGLDALIAALSDADGELSVAFKGSIEAIKTAKGRTIVTGMGKSGHIARKIAATFASTGTPSVYVHPGEASHGDLGMISDEDVVIALSNSGETPELGDIIGYCGRFDIPLIGMTSGAGSTLAQAANITLLIPKSAEACGITKAPTTSTTQMLALGDALAVAMLRQKGFSARDFHKFHPGGKLGAALKRVTDLMHHKEMPLCGPDASFSDAVESITSGGFGCCGVIEENLDFASLLVIGSKRHEKLLAEKLPDAQMVLEPMGRNSAPAVAAAAMMRDPDDLILILPADHDIRNVPAFHDAVAIAAKAAEKGAIVTFGIQPTHAATGYGYIKAVSSAAQSGAIDVEAFVEKPDAETAQRYLDAGDYYWNAGIFLFKAGIMLDALEKYAPGVNAGTRAALGSAQGGAIYLDAEAFAATPSISIDYAVMEKASNVKTVPVSMGWSDVGGYRALHELLTQNETENYTSGPIHLQNSSGLYVRSEGPAISVNGVSDLVIVATDNEVMITPKNDDAAVKELGKEVQENRYALGFSPELRTRARDWLWTAFDVWAGQAWDPERGGFVEQLDMEGRPDRTANRRVRVQARQVFSFAKAIEMGWPGTDAARDLVDRGLDYIDQNLRHPAGPRGGWLDEIDAYGDPCVDTVPASMLYHTVTAFSVLIRVAS
eukprot:g2950.t1